MFSIFNRKVDKKFNDAILGIGKYVTKFEEAAKAAEKEIQAEEDKLGKIVDRADEATEKAYELYRQLEIKAIEKVDEATAKAEARKAELLAIVNNAKVVAESYKKVYLSN